MKTRRAFFRLSAAVAASLLTACVPVLDVGEFEFDFSDIFCDPTGCVGLVVETAVPRMLKGDTVRVSTRSDSGLASPIAWEVTGAGEMVSQSQIDWPTLYEKPGRSILVRGLAPGAVEIKATHPVPRTAKIAMMVADSSVIGAIKLWSYASPKYPGDIDKVTSTTMRVGDSVWVDAILRDAPGQDYAGRPDGWASSDTTIATTKMQATIQPLGRRPERLWVRARAPGTVDVEATFLSVRQTIRITVVP